MPALAGALGDAEPAVARAASQVLAGLGRRHAAVAEVLREALRAEQPRLRIQAALTLARLEPPEPRSLPALVAALDCEEGEVRWAATRILVEMGSGHGEVFPILLNLAREGAPRARAMALSGLRELAPGEPEVRERSPRRHPRPRAWRAAGGGHGSALAGLIEPPPAVFDRLNALVAGDPDDASRRLAVVALARLSAAGAP